MWRQGRVFGQVQNSCCVLDIFGLIPVEYDDSLLVEKCGRLHAGIHNHVFDWLDVVGELNKSKIIICSEYIPCWMVASISLPSTFTMCRNNPVLPELWGNVAHFLESHYTRSFMIMDRVFCCFSVEATIVDKEEFKSPLCQGKNNFRGLLDFYESNDVSFRHDV